MDIIIWVIILGAIFYINKKSKNAGSKNTQPNKPRSQQKQMQQRVQPQQRPQQSNPDIVQRAVKNNARFADDTTQKEIETMHGHSEAQQRLAQEHSRNCQTLHTKAADGTKIIEAETQSMFGSVDDLIAMGYSGNLEFERDFLGEGLDMINNF